VADPDLLAVAEELYAASLDEFVGLRNARAKALKNHPGGRELAMRVRAFRKPALAAWVVNVFVRAQSAQVEEMMGVAQALRTAQQRMDGDDLSLDPPMNWAG